MRRALGVVPCLLALGLVSVPVLAFAAEPQASSGSWSPAGEMSLAREGASAALLGDGRVLITGGRTATGPVAAAEIYDPVAGAFVAAPPMRAARGGHTSVVLEDGRVLVAGGASGSGVLATAEVFDPARNAWSAAGAMTQPRTGHTATRLSDGRVLIAGGDGAQGATASLEVFDRFQNAFSAAGALSSPRRAHAAVLLADGRVLIVGGSNGTASLSSTDLFDPASGRVSPGPALSTARAGASATTLLDGRVLVAGGSDGQTDLASAEIYDPVAKGFSSTTGSLVAARSGHLAFRLPYNNQVLIVGGTSGGVAAAAAELFAPWADASTPTDPLWTARAGATGTPLRRAGRVLVAGGGLATAEIYAFPTLTTDKTDYPAAAAVTIAGTGWQPGETVRLLLHEQAGLHEDRTIPAVADEKGALRASFTAEPHDVAVRFFVTATGTGSQAQSTFTTAAGPAPAAEGANASGTSIQPAQAKPEPAVKAEGKDKGKENKKEKKAREKKEKEQKKDKKQRKDKKQDKKDKKALQAAKAEPAKIGAPASGANVAPTSGANVVPAAAPPPAAVEQPAAAPPARTTAPLVPPGEDLVVGTPTDDTVSDFAAGTLGLCSVVAHTGEADGEVIQQPTVIEDFNGPLGPGWEIVPWPGGGGATFSDGEIHIDGARVNTTASYGPPRTLEFKATFRAEPFQAGGFGETLGLSTETWAIFTTSTPGSVLSAYTRDRFGVETLTPLGPQYVGTEHYYRIEWTTAPVPGGTLTTIRYYIDDVPAGPPHTSLTGMNDMRPIFSNFVAGAPALSVDWARMSPFTPDCTFNSRVFDAGAVVHWTDFTSDQREPAGTQITVCVTVGNNPSPTGTPHCEIPGTGGNVINEFGRYARYTALLVSTDPDRMRTPELHSVTLNYADLCAGVTCADDGNACSLDICNPLTGACGVNAIAGTQCGSSVDDACTHPDTCDAAGVCQPNDVASGTTCGDSSNTECTNPDTCNGSGVCLRNDEPASAPCGSQVDNACTDRDTCDGNGACLANDANSGTSCGDPSDTACTDPDTCNGSGTCLPNHAAAGATCGDTSNTTCTSPDTCNGTGACQPNNAPEGTACNDGQFCTTTDRCASGVCAGSGNPCSDSNVCTPDKCDEATDRCVFNQVCDDDDDHHDDDCDGRVDEEDYDHNGDKHDGEDDDGCDDDEDSRAKTCVLKTTGGGKTLNGAEFGFNVKGVIGSWEKGQFNYRAGNVRIQASVVRILDAFETPDGGVMKFEVVTRDGSRYQVTAEDHGEPGQNRDALTINKVAGGGAAPPTTGRQLVKSGNIQWHGRLDDDDDHGHH